MTAPVRLRGSVGERRRGLERRLGSEIVTEPGWSYYVKRDDKGMTERRDLRVADRRTNLDIARRVDEIISAVREEEGREQAKLLTIIAELRAKIAGLEGRVEGFKIALEQYRAQEGCYERD